MISKSKDLIRADRKKGIAGAVLAALALLVFSVCYGSLKYGVVFAALFLTAGFLRINVRNTAWIYALNLLWAVICTVFVFFVPFNEIFPHYSLSEFRTLVFPGINGAEFLLNLFCIALVMGLLFLLTARWRLSVAVGSFALMVLAIVNGFVYAFRGSEIIFADLLSVNTALNVAGQYDLRISYRTACLLCLWAVLVLGGCGLPELPPRPPLKRRLTALAAGAVLGCVLWFGSADLEIHMWRNEGTWFNGYYLNFYLSIRGYFVEKPQDYSAQRVAQYELEYGQGQEETSGRDHPNIVVIMNESFSDLRFGGAEISSNIPVTPFLDSLEENTVKGYALTSVFGGSTANSEFEVLTGNSMAFMPEGSIPYQQYVKRQTASLAWLLEDRGYESLATHPYYADGWSRTTAYPLLGFRESTFLEDYPGEDLIRSYISDQEMYEYVLEKLDETEDAPLFLFGITMQNHGGYSYSGENYTQEIWLEGYDQDYPLAEQYLTLIHRSDAALEYFLKELEAFPEDTVVLFFGDHLPGIETGFYEELYGGSFDTLDRQMLSYTVPFVIWANYDIPEQTVECTSLNYLGRYLLEAARIGLPPYYSFLKDLEERIPAVNAMGYYSNSRQTYLPLSEAEGEEAQWLSRYEILQYNGMFDKNGRSDVFFGQYIKTE